MSKSRGSPGPYERIVEREEQSTVCPPKRVTCHMSRAMCQVSQFLFFFDNVVKFIGGRSVINEAYPV